LHEKTGEKQQLSPPANDIPENFPMSPLVAEQFSVVPDKIHDGIHRQI
jgi:hypothetical protein